MPHVTLLTEDEMESARAALREGNRRAIEAGRLGGRRALHPRIAALRARAGNETIKDAPLCGGHSGEDAR